MAKKEKNTQSLTLNENWLLSGNKHIYIVKQFDQQGNASTIGYTRTRNEADLLIYDAGKKLFNERSEYRAKKDKYMVTYSYEVQEDDTRFVLHERSLGYLYNGHKIDRFVITFEQVFRSYNRIYSIDELEKMESEIHQEPTNKGKSSEDEDNQEDIKNVDSDVATNKSGGGESENEEGSENNTENDDTETATNSEDAEELVPVPASIMRVRPNWF